MNALTDFEVSLLLEAIEHRWGYDFRGYARASIKRRIHNVMLRYRITHVSELIPRVLHEPAFFQDMVGDFSITVTEMFRNPSVWNVLRTEVFPLLRTWPYFKIWHAACATGEEVYSMMILLAEAKLLERATIYATDFNDLALYKAAAGIYSIKSIQKATRDYHSSGGKNSLSEYYLVQDDVVQMHSFLREQVVWSNHNLTVDRVFGEMNLILCRNALIYFSQPLQNRVLELFTASLALGGCLCLGQKESLDFTSVTSFYTAIQRKERIFQRCTGDQSIANDFNDPKPSSALVAIAKPKPCQGVVAIGCSWGGLQALKTLLSRLPSSFPLPIMITQHCLATSDNSLATILQTITKLTVKEAASGERLQSGCVYLAPADYHLLLNDDWTVGLSSEPQEHYARPSINSMFSSIASVCANNAIGIVLTGANNDGAEGLAKLKAAGAYVMVQDPSEAEVPIMPQAAIDSTVVDCILPLMRLATSLKIKAAAILSSSTSCESLQ
ncbi:MAG: hypothetical protein LAC70_04145 [Methylovulum sp.]|nr:hypothetical protein [Methylovulum sp.]